MAHDTIRYAAYKGKGPQDLAGSHGPVAVESDVMHSYSGVGCSLLNHSLELSCDVTADWFVCGTALSGFMMVLTTRTAYVRALRLSVTRADPGRDELDAYLRDQHGGDEDLLQLLHGVCNFRAWSDACHSRQHIRAVYSQGLAPSFSPGKG